MTSCRSLITSLACLVAVSVPAAVHAAPLTDVVFGNLGTSGTSAVSNTATDVGELVDGLVPYFIAQGFTASGPNLNVQSIAASLFGQSSAATMNIYSSVDGKPGSVLFTSSTVTVGAKSTYVFPFSGAVLSSGVSYWVVPSSPAEVSWYLASAGAPTAQNGSGYSFVGTKESPDGWPNVGIQSYSLSIQAVPEPSTYAMAAIGAGVAGLMGWRRRKVAADTAAVV